jgi:4-hydroxy-tetrahydrodipicolinate synthase
MGEDVPFVVQDFPLTFSVVMTSAVIRHIVMETPSCIMLKHEDGHGLDKISTLRSYEPEGSMRHISIFCGNGGLFLDFEVERGADGAMTGYCFPDMLVDLIRHAIAGRRDDAHDLFDAHLPLLRYEQQPGYWSRSTQICADEPRHSRFGRAAETRSDPVQSCSTWSTILCGALRDTTSVLVLNPL